MPPHVRSKAKPRSTHLLLVPHSSDMLFAHWVPVEQDWPSVAAVRHFAGVVLVSQKSVLAHEDGSSSQLPPVAVIGAHTDWVADDWQ